MRSYFIILILALFHTLPLWNISENIAGGYGDTLAHASIGGWYCDNVVNGNFINDKVMAPFGASMAGSYDSPFPFILTCPLNSLGSLAQFHFFSFLQVFLILVSSWLLSGAILKNIALRWCYILFAWFCGFYITRSFVHETLLSMIWGTQLTLYAFLIFDLKSLKRTLLTASLLALSLSGTFMNIPSLFVLNFLFLLYIIISNKKDWNRNKIINLFAGFVIATLICSFFWAPMAYFTITNSETVFKPGLDTLLSNSFNISDLFTPFSSNLLIHKFQGPFLNWESVNNFDIVIFTIFVFSLFQRSFWSTKLKVTAAIVALFYLYLSFGPKSFINDWLYSIYPFKLVRAPGRFALVSYLITLALTFRFIDELQTSNLKKRKIILMLGAWGLFWGPGLNSLWFFPTEKYRRLIPTESLEYIKNDHRPSIVVMIPSAWAEEPAQNFLQLFHEKPTTSAYLAYTVYNKDLLNKTMADPFLSELGCRSNEISFKNGSLMRDQEKLKEFLLSHNYRYLFFYKESLNNNNCSELKKWALNFFKFPWVQIVQENQFMIVTTFK